MYLISACTLACFYYRGNLHFNLELEPVLNRIKLRDTLTWFSDPSKSCKYRRGRLTRVVARHRVDPGRDKP